MFNFKSDQNESKRSFTCLLPGCIYRYLYYTSCGFNLWRQIHINECHKFRRESPKYYTQSYKRRDCVTGKNIK